MGRGSGEIAVAQLADLVAIDGSDPALCALQTHQVLDGLVFAASNRIVTDLWSAGRHVVKEGRHIHRDNIIAAYRSAMQNVMTMV